MVAVGSYNRVVECGLPGYAYRYMKNCEEGEIYACKR